MTKKNRLRKYELIEKGIREIVDEKFKKLFRSRGIKDVLCVKDRVKR
jgi:hypothetical protein